MLATIGVASLAFSSNLAGGGRSQSLPELAFARVRDNCSQIRTMRADGTHARRVVPCRFGVQSPDWSP